MYGFSGSAGFSKDFHTIHQAETQEGSNVRLAEDDQVFIIRRGKGMGGRNRPNMEQMAIRCTQDAMNLKNQVSTCDLAGKGAKGLICYCCGASAHTPHSCPLPYTPVALVNNDVPDVSWNDKESAWISQWLDQVQDVEEIAVCEVVDIIGSLSVLHSKTDLAPISSSTMLMYSGDWAFAAGRMWILNWLKLAGVDSLPPMTRSAKVFRLRNHRIYPSEGLLRLNGHVKAQNSDNRGIIAFLAFAIDGVKLNLPFLLSPQLLASMKNQIDFRTDELLLPELVKMPRSVAPGGRISRIWDPHSSSVVTAPSRQIEDFRGVSAEDSKQAEQHPDAFLPCIPLDFPSLLKIHQQLGHASDATIYRVCKLAGESVSGETSPQVIRDYECGRVESNPKAPRIKSYQDMAIGETVFSDAIHPNSLQQDLPAILFSCDVSRFFIALSVFDASFV